MKIFISTLVFSTAILFLGSLVSCTSSSSHSSAMKPLGVKASARTSQPIHAMVVGSKKNDSMRRAGITNEDFKLAIESSLTESGLFSQVGSGGYSLEAKIVDVDNFDYGFAEYVHLSTGGRVNLEIGYTLRKKGAIVWRKSIQSTHSSQAFVGVVRGREAAEGAARANIEKLIRQLDQKL